MAVKRITESDSRDVLRSKLSALHSNNSYEFENAIEDVFDINIDELSDSDPSEGFYANFTTQELQDLYNYLTSRNSFESVLYNIKHRKLDASPDYYEGFMDACKIIADEYNLTLPM